MAVNIEKIDHLIIITLDRPKARNAVNGELAQELEAAIDQLEEDGNLWLGILKSSGSVFSAGADLKAIASGNAASMSTKRGGFGGLVKRLRSKPLIAAVGGAAVAGGCELVLACDMVIASEKANFGLPEVKRSLVAAAGGLFRLPRAVGMSVAMEMILTGDPISAQRAYELGLVNRIVAHESLLEESLALANRIVVNAPLAVQASLTIATQALVADDHSLFQDSAKAISLLSKTEDFKEGPRAFIEKRAPNWKAK